jgi:ATP-dependent exoDNAse (exonuclease V) alpha subunit
VLNKSTYYMQSRGNLYTAISRAAKHCCIITDQRSLMYAITHVQTLIDREKSEPRRSKRASLVVGTGGRKQ